MTPLDEIHAQVARQQARRRDIRLTTGDRGVSVTPRGPERSAPLRLRLDTATAQAAALPSWVRISEAAHRHLAGREQVPWTFYRLLLEQNTPLLATVIAGMWAMNPEGRIARVVLDDVFDPDAGAELQAWLWTGFRLFDHPAFLAVAAAATAEVAAEIQGAHLDAELLALWVRSGIRVHSGAEPDGAGVELGALLTNSEVGESRVMARLRLTDPAAGASVVLPEAYAELRATDGHPPEDTLRRGIHAVLGDAGVEHAERVLHAARRIRFTGYPTLWEATACLAQRLALTPEEGAALLGALRAWPLRPAGLPPLWDVALAVASLGGDGASTRRRMELEEAGGTLASMPEPVLRRLVGRSLSEVETERILGPALP